MVKELKEKLNNVYGNDIIDSPINGTSSHGPVFVRGKVHFLIEKFK